MTDSANPHAEIRRIVAHAVGLSPADMADDVDLMTTYAADWRDIARALSKIEQALRITIAPADVGERPTLESIYRAVAQARAHE